MKAKQHPRANERRADPAAPPMEAAAVEANAPPVAPGLRVSRQRYGLIEWNGLSGFTSFAANPAARRGNEQPLGTSIPCELGSICEPMS